MDKTLFERKDYKRSRSAYAFQQTFEYLITLMVTDAFLAKILTYLGISDAVIGIIATFVSLAMFMQLGSILLSRKSSNSKTLSTVCSTVSQVLFAFVYVIPFLPFGEETKKILAIASILVAFSSMYVVWPIIFRWAYRFVSPNGRARYSATKEMLSLGMGIAFTLLVGVIVDKFEGLGNISGAFIFIAISMTIISICNIVCLLSMAKEPESESVQQKKKFSEVLHNTFGNKGFNKCVFAISMWEFAKYFLVGFMGTFKTNDLLIPVSLIQIINTVAALIRILGSKPIARFSDKNGYSKGFQLGLVIAATAFLSGIFTTKSTWLFVVVYTLLYHLSFAGINSNSSNILYCYVDNDYISEALAIKNCIAGVAGFAAALVAGKLLEFVQSSGNVFMGVSVYGQQLLSAVSFVLTIVVLMYVKFAFSEQNENK